MRFTSIAYRLKKSSCGGAFLREKIHGSATTVIVAAVCSTRYSRVVIDLFAAHPARTTSSATAATLRMEDPSPHSYCADLAPVGHLISTPLLDRFLRCRIFEQFGRLVSVNATNYGRRSR